MSNLENKRQIVTIKLKRRVRFHLKPLETITITLGNYFDLKWVRSCRGFGWNYVSGGWGLNERIE